MKQAAVLDRPVDFEWLTTKQVAAKRKCHVVTVLKALESGVLHGHQTVRGGRWLVHPAAVDAWVQKKDGVEACGCAVTQQSKPSKRKAA